MRDVGAPSGVRELGYDDDDIDALVEGAMKQQRLLVVSPREPSEEDIAAIIARLYGELGAGGRFGRITRSRTLNTASSRAKRATGRGTPAKRPSPR